MLRNTMRITMAALAMAVLTVSTPVLAEQTAEELIAKNLEAKGGKAALEGVKSARATGTMTMGPMEAPFIWEWKAPDQFRIEFTIQGMTGVQAFDGTTGWRVMPFMGNPNAEKMNKEELSEIEDMADFRGPLFDPAAKGYEVELVGEEEVDGTAAYKLKLTKDGDETFLFLDKDYFLEIKSTRKANMNGVEMVMDATISDYKEVGPIMMAHSMSMSSAANPQMSQVLTFDKVEINPEIETERFAMPAVEEEEKPKPEGGN